MALTQLERQLIDAVQNIQKEMAERMERVENKINQIEDKQSLLVQEINAAHRSVSELERLQNELEIALYS